MSELQNIFNNREIAISIWVALAVIISIFIKPVKQFLNSVIPILFCHKFVVFYVVFLFHLCLMTYFLYAIGFWSISLLKDTIFWVLFIELPLFVKTIEKAKDNHFFTKLIKDNLAIAVIIEFVINFWTFGLIAEIIIVPVTVFIGLLYALAAREQKYWKVKQLFDWIFVAFGFVLIINSGKHLYENPMGFFNLRTLKEFLLPLLLLLLNLPVIYGLALYNTYEQVFIRVKGNKTENIKMKWSIIKFSGIYLSKITAIHNNLLYTTVISLTDNDMKENLKKLKNKLSMQIGDNYMKRANYYILWCIIGFLISILGIVICNSQVSLKDLIAFNFTMDIPRVKEIITYICSTGVVFSFCFFIYSLGFRKKKNEEISQVKKYALHNLLYLIKRQYDVLQEFPPIDKPKELFVQYVMNAYELKIECDKDIASFENLLASWELDTIRQLYTSVSKVVFSIGIDETEISRYTMEEFNIYYSEKKGAAPQNEQINVFVHDVQKGIEKYSDQIKLCVEEFKRYF
ncbi:hypothetical protein HGO97_020930 [Faecalicatena sp. AGMB00832]|uniref:Uncharacterized protein n=1 Tax=Faecalicatena faecalis TaxID=2726362 RepID=A0ABS6D9H3_9FIRM|nr:hypothetical protein [Faecalicatena faecalis]MBU3878270.1 hypothetical protein [Faecalicatena faecalis]